MRVSLAAEMTTACAGCGIAALAGARLPRGWKRTPTAAYCGPCLHAQYLYRSVTVPIAGPVDATWAEFGAALRASWTQTTACANWIVSELYVRDVRRVPGIAKLPPMPRIYLYPEARETFPGLSPINLTALLQQVEQTYRRQRYELLWTGRRSLAVHRYPVPTPIHAQAWTLDAPAPGNGALILRIRLGDRWWALRLRRGRALGISTAQILALHSGVALAGAGALLAQRAHIGDHRHAETQQRVLVKLVGWFPRVARPAVDQTTTIQTGASSLLRVSTPGQAVVVVHGDALRRLIAGYEVRRHRARQEGRVLPTDRIAARIKTVSQQTIARALDQIPPGTAVVYEDEEHGFCDPFPWSKFRLWLASAVEGRGSRWTYASGQVGDQVGTPLAGSVSA